MLLVMSCQVIVKLTSIHLTPEQPHYKGGGWHCEGAEKEDIIASGIYYYSTHNITPSHLALRSEADKGIARLMPREGTPDSPAKFGKEIPTMEGRCLVFANTLSHKV
jgi:Protein of unknown function (DUF4246)